jgi:hypothetical protein
VSGVGILTHLQARLSTYRGKTMKAKLQVGYKQFVLDHDKAIQILTLLDEAEMFENVYRKEEEGGSTYHIYPNVEADRPHSLELIPDRLYKMWKLAGKPTKG